MNSNNLCTLCNKLFFQKNGENICQSCKIRSPENRNRKRVYFGWSDAADINYGIVQKEGILQESIGVRRIPAQGQDIVTQFCKRSIPSNQQNISQNVDLDVLQSGFKVEDENRDKAQKLNVTKTLYMQYCNLCHALFESSDKRLICSNCELRVVSGMISGTANNLTTEVEGHDNGRNSEEDISIFSDKSTRPSRNASLNVSYNELESGMHDKGKPTKSKLKKSKKFGCEFCRRCFQNSSFLKIHMRSHTGEKPFTCHHCEKKFSQSSSLHTHEKLKHSTDKPYKCDVCNKQFPIQNYLTVHYRTHTKEKPYKCSLCNKSYSQQSSLGTHMKNNH